ncbi:TetR/AcrR family transcriptional regulator [Desulfocurvus sp. DL9XJH121]
MATKARCNNRKETERRLVASVGRILASEGFRALGVNNIARDAGVDKVLIYRYFGGLQELVSAYARSEEFWPPVEELLQGTGDLPSPCPPAKLLSRYFRNFTRAILARPQSIEILAWEMVERNELTDIVNARRERMALELLDRLGRSAPHSLDAAMVLTLVAGAVNHLLVASMRRGSMGGADLRSDEGWDHIHDTLDIMLIRLFG